MAECSPEIRCRSTHVRAGCPVVRCARIGGHGGLHEQTVEAGPAWELSGIPTWLTWSGGGPGDGELARVELGSSDAFVAGVAVGALAVGGLLLGALLAPVEAADRRAALPVKKEEKKTKRRSRKKTKAVKVVVKGVRALGRSG